MKIIISSPTSQKFFARMIPNLHVIKTILYWNENIIILNHGQTICENCQYEETGDVHPRGCNLC